MQPENLFERLTEIGAIDACLRHGCAHSGLPRSWQEDAHQEMRIEFLKTTPVNDMSNGECVNCGKTIAKRAAIKVRRRMSQQTTIPDREWRKHDELCLQNKTDISEDINESSMLSFGHVNTDDHTDDESQDQLTSILDSYTEELTVEQRLRADEILRNLPRAQIALTYNIAVLGDSVGTASDRMGIDEGSCKKYVDRIVACIEEMAL